MTAAPTGGQTDLQHVETLCRARPTVGCHDQRCVRTPGTEGARARGPAAGPAVRPHPRHSADTPVPQHGLRASLEQGSTHRS